jgi:beta-lactamase superfamily II metal-dependent hydrolase
MGNVEVAKVNHHGSSYSSNSTWVTTLDAEAAVISVGKNSFGHPDATVVARWDTSGDVYQTQSPVDNSLIDGNISVLTDGLTGFTVTTSTDNHTVTYTLDETD